MRRIDVIDMGYFSVIEWQRNNTPTALHFALIKFNQHLK